MAVINFPFHNIIGVNNFILILLLLVLVNFIFGIFISPQRKFIEAQLVQQATHDSLTGLPNRNLFLDRFNQAILQSERAGLLIGILFLDIDRFKLINDSLGHSIGDDLLKAIAAQLQHCVRNIDTVSRLGGDEFVILFPFLNQEQDIFPLIEKITANLRRPFMIKQHELHIAASLGVCFYPKDGHNVETLMNNSDSAMYHAKELGGNNYQFYQTEINYYESKNHIIQ